MAETTLPLPVKTFQAASPNAGGDRMDPAFSFFQPPTTYPAAQSHAEQGLVGKVAQAILDEGSTEKEFAGHTLFLHIEQPVCFNCKQGLFGSKANAGILKQFSQKFPTLHVQVTAEGTDEVIRILGGNSTTISEPSTPGSPSASLHSSAQSEASEEEATTLSEASEEDGDSYSFR